MAEAAQEIAAAVVAPAFAVSYTRLGPDSFTFVIQVNSVPVGVALGVGVTAVSLAAIYFSSRTTAQLVRGAFERAFGAGGEDRDVGDINRGSLLFKLHCYTAASFLEFLEDYESGKVKQCLKEELSSVGIEVENLWLEIKNMKEAIEHKQKLRGIERNKDIDAEQSSSSQKPTELEEIETRAVKLAKEFGAEYWSVSSKTDEPTDIATPDVPIIGEKHSCCQTETEIIPPTERRTEPGPSSELKRSSSVTMVREIPFLQRQKICKLLNVEKCVGDDFQTLAGHVKMPHLDLQLVCRNKDPAREVMFWWEPQNSATIQKFKEILKEMKRDDVLEIVNGI